MSQRVDPITQEIVRYGLDAIAEQMEATLLRSAFSTIVKEGLDASAAIFDSTGQNLAQAASIPNHLGCMIPAVEEVLSKWSTDEMRPGDVFILNDPYGGGTHLPDIAIISPIFFDTKVIALGATMSHHQEIGGMVAGSLPPNATDVFQEGLRLPAMKLVDEGEPIQQVFDILTSNVRTPDVVLGDLRAQIAAVRMAEKRLSEAVAGWGIEDFKAASAQLLDDSEVLTRTSLAKIPDGTYSFEDWLDDDGVDLDKPIRIMASLTVAGDTVTIDFTGTADQVRGPFNCVRASTMAAVYYVVRAVTGAEIPDNAGCYRPIEVVLPNHSVLNPDEPAAVNSRTATLRRVCDVLLGCFGQAIPERVPAASCGQLLVMNFGGVDPRTGRFYVTSELGVGGMGARPGIDGVDAIDTDATNCMNVPAEAIEMDSPIRVLSWRITPESAGPGKWRGGFGTDKVFQLIAGEATANYRGERHTTAPWGVGGGGSATFSSAQVVRADGTVDQLRSKTMVDLAESDRLHIFICGGGGYGSPLERDPNAVLSDVVNGRQSKRFAKENYGVITSPDGSVDLAATNNERQSRKEA